MHNASNLNTPNRKTPHKTLNFVSHNWVKAKLDPSVPIEEVVMITNDVNAIIRVNPTVKQLNNSIRLQQAVAKTHGTVDRNLIILYLARSAMARSATTNSIYNFA